MKLKEGYIYRKIAGEHVVIPIGGNIADFNGIISLNETAAFLWNKLKGSFDRDSLISALTQEYDVEHRLAGEDVNEFLTLLKEHKVVIDE